MNDLNADVAELLGYGPRPAVKKSIRDQVRQNVDGADSFMRGFLLGQMKRYKRKRPLWANNDAKVKKILLSAFPKMKTDAKQCTAAVRWWNVINLYFWNCWTAREVAEELNVPTVIVRGLVRRVQLAAKGCRTSGPDWEMKYGGGPRGGKEGRPKGWRKRNKTNGVT
jgi:hypothetical protein